MNVKKNERRPDRQGFTLIEIIIAVAIVAILAGTIAPMAFKEMIKAREDATVNELNNLNQALMDFYEDTGRFPDETEGLTALVSDPGVNRWQGPYVGGDRSDPVAEVGTDAFDGAYTYDLNPTTNPANAADVLVASSGADGNLTFGRLNNTWTLSSDGDDLLTLVSAGPVNREKLRLCEEELQAIGEAAGNYFVDHATFPVIAADLTSTYLDAGIGGGNFVDPWNMSYVLAQTGGGGAPLEFLVRSFGPDRTNNNGGNDDLTLNVSSVPPGRKATLYKLQIAQTVLNNNGSLALTGAWGTDRSALGLDAAFGVDGWGRSLQVNVASRTIFSVGPDGNASLITDNLPAGVGP
jgi:general secretion pathway protein G